MWDTIVYILIFTIIVSFWVQIYLQFFPLRYLYTNVCLKRKNRKINFLFYRTRLRCLREAQDEYPAYEKSIKKLLSTEVFTTYATLISIVVIVLLVFFGVIKVEPSSNHVATMTEKLTVTKIEGNKTTVKVFKNLEDFLK